MAGGGRGRSRGGCLGRRASGRATDHVHDCDDCRELSLRHCVASAQTDHAGGPWLNGVLFSVLVVRLMADVRSGCRSLMKGLRLAFAVSFGCGRLLVTVMNSGTCATEACRYKDDLAIVFHPRAVAYSRAGRVAELGSVHICVLEVVQVLFTARSIAYSPGTMVFDLV